MRNCVFLEFIVGFVHFYNLVFSASFISLHITAVSHLGRRYTLFAGANKTYLIKSRLGYKMSEMPVLHR